MTLFWTETVPVPYDAETYLGLRQQYTEVQLNDTYFVVGTDRYTLLSRKQLELCIKLRTIYYCEQAYLVKSKEFFLVRQLYTLICHWNRRSHRVHLYIHRIRHMTRESLTLEHSSFFQICHNLGS